MGSKEGGIRVRAINLAKDPDYYHKLGKMGGKWRGRKGFAAMPKSMVSAAGRKGGSVSRRRRSTIKG